MAMHRDTESFEARLTAELRTRGLLAEGALAQVQSFAATAPEADLATWLVRAGVVAEYEMSRTIATLTAAPLVRADAFPLVPLFRDALPSTFLRQVGALPLADTAAGLEVAFAAPYEPFAAQALGRALQRTVIARTGLRSEIDAAVRDLYGAADEIDATAPSPVPADPTADLERLQDLASGAPVVHLVNRLLEHAIGVRASDIHLTPCGAQLSARVRVDGHLREVEIVPAPLAPAVVSRIKLLAGLNIAERRLPQDGRVQIPIHGRSIDVRISTIPALRQESVVLRLLDRSSVQLEFEALGFAAPMIAQLRQLLALPYGMMLVTGPTGSGKTTTLYSALRVLHSPERQLVTVEDPVEYQLDGITQIQVKPEIGLTFAQALRSVLRHDPDVILVGEMRDTETARIAVQSALTGHLVLATLHTNHAGSTVTRLLDMGIEPFLVTSTVRAVLAQRLVRRLCLQCRVPLAATEAHRGILARLGLQCSAEAGATYYAASGCPACYASGYAGRRVIAELMVMQEALRARTLERADGAALEALAVSLGMVPMARAALELARTGLVSVADLLHLAQDTDA